METGIIYLIQPAELLGTNRYKIGCSKKNNLKRCSNGYKKGSRYMCIMECNKPLILEKKIINKFNEKFKKICGNEFFEGEEKEIIKEGRRGKSSLRSLKIKRNFRKTKKRRRRKTNY